MNTQNVFIRNVYDKKKSDISSIAYALPPFTTRPVYIKAILYAYTRSLASQLEEYTFAVQIWAFYTFNYLNGTVTHTQQQHRWPDSCFFAARSNNMY